jgi:hypothetical protein
MEFTIGVLVAAIGLFAGMVALVHLGQWLGARRHAKDPTRLETSGAAIDAAVLGLLGLLVAFTFSGAASRFDMRRQLIIDETNAIGTAYLRLSMLPAATRAPIQQQFRRYADSRVETYHRLPDLDAALAEWRRTKKIQQDIWGQAVDATRAEGAPIALPMVLLPALNQMFDLAATRTALTQMHPPTVVYVMLFAIALLSALLAGDGMARRKAISRVHVIGFALIMAAAVYVIIDLEFPRLGLFQVDDFDRLFADVRAGMN